MYDVVISGAGPAGSLAACLCARKGLRTLLLERSTISRPKCCAGGVLYRALRLLDFELPKEIVERELNGFHIVSGKKRYYYELGARVGVTVRREKFDAYLARRAEEAGAELMLETEVQKIEECRDKVLAATNRGEFDSRFVVLAEGSNSRNTGALLGPFPERGLALGIATEFKVTKEPGNSAGIYLMGSGKGSPVRVGFPMAGATFPRRSSVMASVVATGKDFPSLKEAVSIIEHDISEALGPIESFQPCVHSIPIVPRERLCTRRVLAVGDAAGFVSPFSGEGLTHSLMSARMASEVIEAEAQKDGPVSLRAYEMECRRQILRRMTVARIVGHTLHWLVDHGDQGMFLGNVTKDRELITAFASLARGDLSVSGFVLKSIMRTPHLVLSDGR
jgi:geranylgeranyl reductase family protein